jgi:hypothetical protein
MESPSGTLLRNPWARAGGGLVLALALTAFALGSGGSGPSKPKVHRPDVVIAAGRVGTAPPGDFVTAVVTAGVDAATTARPAAAVTAAPDLTEASQLAADGIPSTALIAYQDGASREHRLDPSCGFSWPLLAAIGRVESDHGRSGGALLHTDGLSTPRIIGIPLNGHGTALIRDSDHGVLDGDSVYDHAVGPMQFIPTTWGEYAVDGNSDGKADPFNIMDAAATAARYLCAAAPSLTTLAGQTQALRAYNDSDAYITLVLATESIYAKGVPGLTVPTPPTGAAPSTPPAHVPPANPGAPLGLPGTDALLPVATTPAPSSTARSSTAASTPSGSASPSSSPAGPSSSSSSPSSSSSTSASPTASDTPTSSAPASSSSAGTSTAPPTSSSSPSSPAPTSS